MFCPSCGTENAQALRYCKRCGANLTDTTHLVVQESNSPSSRYTGAAWAVALASVVICLGGIGIVFSTVWDVIGPYHPGPRSGDATMVAMTMLIMGMTTIFGVVALLIRLFTRLMTAPSEPQDTVKTIKPITTGHTPLQLPAPPAAVSSVTEHTTRTFQHAAYEELSRRE